MDTLHAPTCCALCNIHWKTCILMQQIRKSLKITIFCFALAFSYHVDLNQKRSCSILFKLLLTIETSRFILMIVYVLIVVLSWTFFFVAQINIYVCRRFNTGPGRAFESNDVILRIFARQCYSKTKWCFRNCIENVVHLFIFLKEIYHCVFAQKLSMRLSMYLWLVETLDLMFVHSAGRVRYLCLLDCPANIRYRQPSSPADNDSQVILKVFQAMWITPIPFQILYRWFMYVLLTSSHDFLGCCIFSFLVHICHFLCIFFAQLFLWSYHISILHFFYGFNNVFVKLSSFYVWNPLTCCELNYVKFAKCSKKLALIPICWHTSLWIMNLI